MANHLGSEGSCTVGGNTVAEFLGWSVDETANVVDDSETSDTAMTYKADQTSWTASIECMFDETDTTGQEAMTIGASVSLVFLPEGNTTGDVRLSGTALITGRSHAVAKGAMQTQTFSVQGTGALTRDTVP